MHLSISSSSERAPEAPWSRVWIVALLVFLVVFTIAEAFWRARGVRPSVTDTPDLWANARDQIQHSGGKKVVAVLGQSRIQLGFSPRAFAILFPDYELVNLSINAACPLATLRDVAMTTEFRGVALVSITAWCFLPPAYRKQQEYVDHYHNVWGLNRSINAEIAASVQAIFAVGEPTISLKNVVKHLVWWHRLPEANYLITRTDRFREADYRLLGNIEEHRAKRVKTHTKRLLSAPPPSSSVWLANALATEPWLHEIQGRGGQVVFVRFPTSGRYWAVDEQVYPRKKYWDGLAARSSGRFIHFKDIPGAESLPLPDASHLDVRDSPMFTRMLLKELQRAEILPIDMGDAG